MIISEFNRDISPDPTHIHDTYMHLNSASTIPRPTP